MAALVEVPFEVQKPQAGLRVDQFLSQRLQRYSRAQVQRMIYEGKVFLRGRRAKASLRLIAGDTVVVKYPKTIEPECRFPSLPVVFEDEYLLAVNKPGDLLSHPTDKIVENAATSILKKQFPATRLFLTHRLDRETSGVLLFAKSSAAARKMSALFAGRGVKKTYLAIVRGRVVWKKLRVDQPLGREGLGIYVRQKTGSGQPAVTEFSLLECGKSASLVSARPLTGRLHQIRVHLAHVGHPILGDKLYTGAGELYMKTVNGTLTKDDLAALGAERQMLHAASVAFAHPMTGEALLIEAAMPADFRLPL